jgi:hypothetical protein
MGQAEARIRRCSPRHEVGESTFRNFEARGSTPIENKVAQFRTPSKTPASSSLLRTAAGRGTSGVPSNVAITGPVGAGSRLSRSAPRPAEARKAKASGAGASFKSAARARSRFLLGRDMFSRNYPQASYFHFQRGVELLTPAKQ